MWTSPFDYPMGLVFPVTLDLSLLKVYLPSLNLTLESLSFPFKRVNTHSPEVFHQRYCATTHAYRNNITTVGHPPFLMTANTGIIQVKDVK